MKTTLYQLHALLDLSNAQCLIFDTQGCIGTDNVKDSYDQKPPKNYKSVLTMYETFDI